MAQAKIRAVIVGHSFVRITRGFAYAQLEDSNPDCHLTDVCVEWYGHGGLRLHQLDRVVPPLISVQPELFVLDIGTNDLSPPGVCALFNWRG